MARVHSVLLTISPIEVYTCSMSPIGTSCKRSCSSAVRMLRFDAVLLLSSLKFSSATQAFQSRPSFSTAA